MRSQRFGRGVLLAAVASATLALAGCETATTYHPLTGHGFYSEGYSERQIEPNRFLVSFAGNEVTSRDTVERYLLYRAAQLTLQQGNDYFVEVNQDTDRQTRTYAEPGIGGPYGGPGWGAFGFGGYWGPAWRFHRGFGAWGAGGWGGWGGWGYGDPFYDGFDIRTVDRVEAQAQIVMYRGPIPRGNPRAFDAHAVVATLGPTIIRPGQERNRRDEPRGAPEGQTPPPPNTY